MSPHERTMLVDHMRWALLEPASDPFDDGPGVEPCSEMLHRDNGFGFEDFGGEEAFYLQSSDCNYLTAAQSSLVDVREGELVKIRLWHFELTSPDGGEAHIVVRLGEDTLFEDHVPIPSGSEVLIARWTAPTDIPAGTPVVFHLHNHGANEYVLIEVSTGPQE